MSTLILWAMKTIYAAIMALEGLSEWLVAVWQGLGLLLGEVMLGV